MSPPSTRRNQIFMVVSPSSDKIGVIALVPDRWDGIRTTRHHVISRLAAHFEVVWVEPVRGWRDYWLPKSAVAEPLQVLPTDIPGLTRFDPGRWLPEVYRFETPARWIRHARLRIAKSILRKRGCSKIVLYIWRPKFHWSLDAIARDATTYHIDDEYQFARTGQPQDNLELELLTRSDLVIIHSPKLLEKKGSANPNTVFVPNGVDFNLHSRPHAEPADIRSIPKPRAGYVGVIKSQLDMAVLLELSCRRPDWSIVLVGPVGRLGSKVAQFDQLKRNTNVHVLGNRQASELPAYMQHFDACLMPYEVNDYTNSINPLKLQEYLAGGRPVISSPIHAVQQFRNVVEIADSSSQWELALDNALRFESNSTAAIMARRTVAARFDWDTLVAQIADSMRKTLRDKQLQSEVSAAS